MTKEPVPVKNLRPNKCKRKWVKISIEWDYKNVEEVAQFVHAGDVVEYLDALQEKMKRSPMRTPWTEIIIE